MEIRVAHYEGAIMGQGPGLRSVVWVDSGGRVESTLDLAAEAAREENEGLTITGGEPLEQLAAVDDFVFRWSEAGGRGTVILFTGRGMHELPINPFRKESRLFFHLDVLVTEAWGEPIEGLGLVPSNPHRKVHLLTRDGREWGCLHEHDEDQITTIHASNIVG